MRVITSRSCTRRRGPYRRSRFRPRARARNGKPCCKSSTTAGASAGKARAASQGEHAAVIEYDRHRWNRVAFSFYGTVLPRVLGRVGVLTGFTLLLCLLNDYVLGRYGYPL